MKWWVLAQPPYSPKGSGRHSPRVEPFNQGDRPPDAENPWSQYRQRLGGQARPRAQSRCIQVKQEQHECGPPDLPTIEPRLPPPHPDIYILLLLLLKSNPSRQQSKVLYCWRAGEEERQEIKEK